MKPRILILPVAAVLITALVAWRYQRESASARRDTPQVLTQLAPQFELYDQHSRMVKFGRYLGRTELFVVFFDGDTPAEENPLLTWLRDHHAAIASSDVQVVAISLATPHAIREAERRTSDFPFPVLTDIDLQTPIPAPVHRLWGLTDDDTGTIRTGAFFVDRSGKVASNGLHPQPLDDPLMFLTERLEAGN